MERNKVFEDLVAEFTSAAIAGTIPLQEALVGFCKLSMRLEEEGEDSPPELAVLSEEILINLASAQVAIKKRLNIDILEDGDRFHLQNLPDPLFYFFSHHLPHGIPDEDAESAIWSLQVFYSLPLWFYEAEIWLNKGCISFVQAKKGAKKMVKIDAGVYKAIECPPTGFWKIESPIWKAIGMPENIAIFFAEILNQAHQIDPMAEKVLAMGIAMGVGRGWFKPDYK